MVSVLTDEITPVAVPPRTQRPSRTIGTLAVLGDSIAVGVGDPALGGGWRGFPPMLAQACGASLVNVSINGARLDCVRRKQLPTALAARPDAAVVMVGMNNTMRSDFDAARLGADLDHVVSELIAAGSLVVTIRYHDHGKVFRLPGPLRRALSQRIGALNAEFDAVAARHGAGVVDLGTLADSHRPEMWSVDRLHPSELGHRMLARAFAGRLAEAGALLPGEVSLECAGSRPISRLDHVAWLVVKGIPWLFRRGGDLVPYALATLIRSVFA
jgi:lysophospholipase L1-like esterase